MSGPVGVARPNRTDAHGGGCWARIVPRRGPFRGRELPCGNQPRVRALTCHRHKHLEGAARRLKAKLEQEGQ